MPSVLGGIAVTVLGVRTATGIYALAIAVIAATALVLRLSQIRAERHAVMARAAGTPAAAEAPATAVSCH
ncbi:hypothetical protein GCM10017744_005930 [Streptomyces antimycoticus]